MLHTRRTFSFESPLEEADVALLGIPFDSTETGSPVRFGSLFIREALKALPGYDPQTGRNVFEELSFCDLGDVEVVPGSWELTNAAIQETVKEMFQTKQDVFPVVLGGEHLITLGIIQALQAAAFEGKKLTIIDFDAHRDLMQEWMGLRHSHITWAWHALQLKNVELIQLGCRSWYPEEESAFKNLRIKERLEAVQNPVYLTIDLDVLDPKEAPEVGTPEPAGLGSQELFSLLEKACQNQLIGLDIMECASDRVNTQTALLAAQIIKKVLGWKRK
jgi:agmatinase